jgi:streptogramin lyase
VNVRANHIVTAWSAFFLAVVTSGCGSFTSVPASSPAATTPSRAASPSVVQFRLYDLHGNVPWEIANGPDGNIWFAAAPSRNKKGYVGRIAGNGVLSSFPITVKNFYATNIVTGSDGHLWVDDAERGLIRVNVSGKLTPYPITSKAITSCCDTLAAASGGDLWLAAQNVNSGVVLKVDQEGRILETIPLNAEDAPIGAMIPGPSGAVWITTQFDHQETSLRLLATAGTLRNFKIAKLGSIAVGGDGNFWAGQYAERIARITPSGAITDFFVGVKSGPGPIVAGPDGTLWFVMSQAGAFAVAHMNLKGTIVAKYRLPPAVSPNSLCVARDGRIWVSAVIVKTLPGGGAQFLGQIVTFQPVPNQ